MKKRHQHYVWKAYLRPWSVNDQIWCHRDGNIFSTNLKGVAQQRDFYRLQELTENDISIITRVAINGTKNILLREVNAEWIRSFQAIFKIKKNFERIGMKNVELEKLIDKNINNLEEDLHSHIETESVPYLNSLNARDTSLFHDDEKYMKFCYFLAIQYLRTNKIKQNLVRNIGDVADGHIKRSLGVIRHIYATNIAWSIFANKHSDNFKPTLLLNSSSINFIAGDQPIINTHAVISGYSEIVNDVEFYYPISPNIALIISKDRFCGEGDQVKINEEQVVFFNKLIASSAEEQIFGKKKVDLEPYIKICQA